MKKFLVGILFLVSILSASYRLGDIVNDISWTDSFGEEHSLQELTDAGKTVVIFWGEDWCGGCNDAAPIINEWWKQNKDNGDLYVLSRTDWSTVSGHQSYDYQMPVWEGIDEHYGDFGNGYVPFFAVIGKNRNLIYGDNSVDGAMNNYANGQATFNGVFSANNVQGLNFFANETKVIDLSTVFEHSTGGDFSISYIKCSNPTAFTGNVEGTNLTLTSGDVEGLFVVTVKAEAEENMMYKNILVAVKEVERPVLYSQLEVLDSEETVDAQNFESTYNAYDCWVADDFTVPAGEEWKIREIEVDGNNSDKSPFNTWSVKVFADDNGKPGSEVYNNIAMVSVVGIEKFYIQFEDVLTLSEGKYWLAVQANRTLDKSGQWHWKTEGSEVAGSEFMWMNEADGWGTGAIDWTSASDLGFTNKNLAFSINTLHATGINDPNFVKTTELLRNYPNPFNPSTSIEYKVEKFGKVSLKVFNAKGEMIADLVNGVKEAGLHNISFDASNLNSGIYFYQLKTNSHNITKKMILTK